LRKYPFVPDRPCINCNTIFTPWKRQRGRKIVKDNSRKCCSPKCVIAWISNNQARKDKISKAFTGSNHPNWKGGMSMVRNLSKRGSGWLKIAEEVRDRDGRKCTKCNKTENENGRKLDVHHIRPFHEFKTTKEANLKSNLISMCKSCHRKQDSEIEVRQFLFGFDGSVGRKSYKRGEEINTNKLTGDQILEIRERSKIESQASLAREFCCTITNINAIVHRKTWKHL
jgi:hypothetical protein